MFGLAPSLMGGGNPYGASLRALLHFNGADGSTTFTDEVGNTWAVDAGSPTISTAQSKFGGSSLRIPHASTRLRTTAAGLLLLGDYSIEAWVYVDAGTVYPFVLQTSGGSGLGISFYADSTGVFHGRGSAATIGKSDGAGTLAGRWVHAYAGHSGNTNYVGCNGQINSSAGDASALGAAVSYVDITNPYTGAGVAGYVDELAVAASCRWTSDFTPPSSPYANP